MNRAELVHAMAQKSGMTKKDTAVALEAFVSVVTETVPNEKVVIVGFGSWESIPTPERVGRNPKNGTEVTIPASNRVKFKVGKELKDVVKV